MFAQVNHNLLAMQNAFRETTDLIHISINSIINQIEISVTLELDDFESALGLSDTFILFSHSCHEKTSDECFSRLYLALLRHYAQEISKDSAKNRGSILCFRQYASGYGQKFSWNGID
ncbi:UNKNOWN [Stylonychia lemnae]|uniref:Uncharacterized protein n=1 Tax=Stylonychia lemnae TaxID=5949 RepID=A0A078A0M2_STYLE|nr:UNKNOWN [Stylonychia lemnae]|eukprot:CDW75008.1 UNKNOWN [Stylonychia lemnae]